jgi:hypothetical protein
MTEVEYRAQRIKDYNAGYTDAQCNHVNDAENYVNESEYAQESSKEEQKRLITEIMNEDAKDGLYQEQTAVDWLYKELYGTPRTLWEDQITKIFDKAREIEKERTDKAYSDGITDGRYNTPRYKYFEYQNK